MTDPEIKQIICGCLHTMIYRNNGDVLVFGDNSYGQLGLGGYQNRNKAELLMTIQKLNRSFVVVIIP